MSAADHNSRIQFHASAESLDEFMHAPVLHVGTRKAAKTLTRDRLTYSQEDRGKTFKTHALAFSKHADFHDEVLSDEEANEAHAQFLEQRNIKPSSSVNDSRTPNYRSTLAPLGQEKRIQGGVDALSRNKIVRYTNSTEDTGSISHMVPSPYMNMRSVGQKDPQKQPVLPMDYSPMEPSSRTRRDKK